MKTEHTAHDNGIKDARPPIQARRKRSISRHWQAENFISKEGVNDVLSKSPNTTTACKGKHAANIKLKVAQRCYVVYGKMLVLRYSMLAIGSGLQE